MKGSLTGRSYFMLKKKRLVMHLKGLFPWVIFSATFTPVFTPS